MFQQYGDDDRGMLLLFNCCYLIWQHVWFAPIGTIHTEPKTLMFSDAPSDTTPHTQNL
jgi:hypothetical protein